MIKENKTIARAQGLAGKPSQDGERAPYKAPWIEMHMVGLEGGIADGSSKLTGETTENFTYDDYATGSDSEQIVGDIQF